MKLTTINRQKGIGLIEVLVALLILAVAILGFSAMQMSAVRTTDESVMRSRAMTVMRSGAEVMRSNPEGILPFRTRLNALQTTTTKVNIATKCITTGCTPAQLAERDAEALHNYALENEVRINLLQCPNMTGNQIKQCMIASWGETMANFGGAANSCANATGTIQSQASCFVVEVY